MPRRRGVPRRLDDDTIAETFVHGDGLVAFYDGDVVFEGPLVARHAWRVHRRRTWELWAAEPVDYPPAPPFGAVRWDRLSARLAAVGWLHGAARVEVATVVEAGQADLDAAADWRRREPAAAREVTAALAVFETAAARVLAVARETAGDPEVVRALLWPARRR
jgi:hypothetical protein